MNARVRAAILPLSLSLGLPCVLALSQPPALAQDDASTVAARQRFQEGVALFDAKKYEQARAAFLQAYALKKHPDVLLNLAQSELLSGHPLEANQHFKEFLRDPATAQHARRTDATRGLEESRAKIGRIQVTVDQTDAEVFVDGKKVGTSPLAEPVDLPPGAHAVEARKNGKTAAQNITAPEGKIVIANLTIESSAPPVVPTASARPEPVKPPPPPATTTTSAPPPPPPPTATTPPDTSPDETPSSGREPFMRWASHSPVAYVGAGLTLVGVGVGVGFLIAQNNAQNNADTLASKIRTSAASDPDLQAAGRSGNPCAEPIPTGAAGNYRLGCSNLRTNLDAADTNKKVAIAGFVVGGVGVLTIIGGYFLTSRRTDSGALPGPSFALSPVLGPGLSGLSASGQF